MRRRILLVATLALPSAWSCTSFSGADADAGTPTEAGAADTASDGPPVDGGSDSGRCGTCEIGGCGTTGCAAYDVTSGLHDVLTSWEASGLATSEDTAFVSGRTGTALGSPGAIWKISLPKKPLDPPSPATRIHDGKRISDLATLNNGIYFVEENAGATPVLSSFAKNGQLTDNADHVVYGAFAVRTNNTHVVAANNAGVLTCDPTLPPSGCKDLVTVSVVTQLGAGQADYCFAGVYAGTKGIFCGASLGGAPHLQFQTNATVNAMVVRGGDVYWTTDTSLSKAGTSAGDTTLVSSPIASVRAIGVDSGDLYYAIAEKLYRCEKTNCQTASSTLVGTAPAPIQYLSIEKDFVYFLYGGGTGTQIARFPR